MRAREPFPNQLDFVRVESTGDERGRTVTAYQPVQDFVGFGVADSKVALVRLSLDQVGRRRLLHDDIGHAEEFR